MSDACILLAHALAEMMGKMQEAATPVVVKSSRYVTVKLAASLTGFSEKAIRRKKEEGVWIEGSEWVCAPDGTILVDMEGYERWVARGRA